MKDLFEHGEGRWVQADAHADGKEFERLSRTLVAPYIRHFFDPKGAPAERAEFYGFVVGSGDTAAMPVILMVEPASEDGDRPKRPLISGYANSDPYPNYGVEIAALSERIDVPLPPECFLHRGDLSYGAFVRESEHGKATQVTPRFEGLAMPTVVELFMFGRWAELTSERDFERAGEMLGIPSGRIRELGAEDGCKVMALVDQNGMPFQMPVIARIAADDGASTYTGADGADPSENFENQIAVLSEHLGKPLSFEPWRVETAPTP